MVEGGNTVRIMCVCEDMQLAHLIDVSSCPSCIFPHVCRIKYNQLIASMYTDRFPFIAIRHHLSPLPSPDTQSSRFLDAHRPAGAVAVFAPSHSLSHRPMCDKNR